MAEQIVFGADIDNVTIKNINGKLVAIGGSESAEDEVEVLSSHQALAETDENYVESVSYWLRHKATQAVWEAKKEEFRARSAPVSESFVSGPAFDAKFTTVNVDNDNLELMLADAEITSAVDNKVGKPSEFFTNVPVEHFSKSGFENAKAFNEAHADSKYRVTTKKRYAESTEHPIVQETTLELPYPKLPYYVEENLTTLPANEKHYIYSYIDSPDFRSFSYRGESNAIYSQYFNELRNSGRLQVQVHYKLTLEDNRVIEGDHTIYQIDLDREEVPDYADNVSNIVSQEWTFSPITVQGFYGKFVVTPGVYTQ